MALFDRKRLEVATEGAWVTGKEVAAFGDGAILVRGLASDAVRDAFATKARSTKKADRAPDGSLLPSCLTRHTREVLSEHCVLDAKDLPYTADEIRKMLQDPAYEALITAVIMACQHVDALSQEIEEQTSKN